MWCCQEGKQIQHPCCWPGSLTAFLRWFSHTPLHWFRSPYPDFEILSTSSFFSSLDILHQIQGRSERGPDTTRRPLILTQAPETCVFTVSPGNSQCLRNSLSKNKGEIKCYGKNKKETTERKDEARAPEILVWEERGCWGLNVREGVQGQAEAQAFRCTPFHAL